MERETSLAREATLSTSLGSIHLIAAMRAHPDINTRTPGLHEPDHPHQAVNQQTASRLPANSSSR